VEVSDASPTPAVVKALTSAGGYGLAVVVQIATRWGTERQAGRNVTWFELHLPTPGS
jgi:hypothetical protein